MYLIGWCLELGTRGANPSSSLGGVFWISVTFWPFSNFGGCIIIRGENPSSAMGVNFEI